MFVEFNSFDACIGNSQLSRREQCCEAAKFRESDPYERIKVDPVPYERLLMDPDPYKRIQMDPRVSNQIHLRLDPGNPEWTL